MESKREMRANQNIIMKLKTNMARSEAERERRKQQKREVRGRLIIVKLRFMVVSSRMGTQKREFENRVRNYEEERKKR